MPYYPPASTEDATKLPLAGGTMTGAILGAAGAVGSPGYAFSGDTNTGMWSPAADTIAWSTNGSERMRLTSGGFFLVARAAANPLSTQLQVGVSASFERNGDSDFMGPSIEFIRSRGTEGARTAIAAADFIGEFSWRGYTTSFSRMAAFGAKAESTTTAYIYFENLAGEIMRLNASGNVGIGTGASINAAALLEIASTTKGVLFPRMTTTQRDAISSPPSGLVIYNTTTGKLNVRGAAAWEAVTSA